MKTKIALILLFFNIICTRGFTQSGRTKEQEAPRGECGYYKSESDYFNDKLTSFKEGEFKSSGMDFISFKDAKGKEVTVKVKNLQQYWGYKDPHGFKFRFMKNMRYAIMSSGKIMVYSPLVHI